MKFLASLLTACLVVAALTPSVRSQPLPEETVFVDRAVLAYDAKRFSDALQELSEALRLNPNSYQALYYQGLVLQELERPTEAREALERAQRVRPQSLDIAFQLGVAYIKQDSPDKAEPLLRKVYAAEPKRPNLGYYLGLIEYRKNNFFAASELFRANVPSDESFAQLSRYYSGLAMSAIGFPREARTEFAEALRIRPNSPLAAGIPRLSEELDKGARETRAFHGEIRLGLLYDTQASVALDPSLDVTVIRSPQFGPSTILVGPSQERSRSFGELATVDLSYRWLRTKDWEGTVGYRFVHVEKNQAADFSIQAHSPAVSIVHRGLVGTPLGEFPYFAGTRGIYEYIREGNAGFLQRWTINPYYSLLESRNNVTNLQFRLQVKDYYDDPTGVTKETRDALNYMVGPTHFFLFDSGRHYIKVGYQYDYENAEGANWTYSGNRLLVGFQYTLPWNDIQFRYDFDRHWRAYRNPHSLLPQSNPGTNKRDDAENIHSASLSKDFTAAAQKFNFSVDYFFDRAESNLSPFSFSRHVVMPSLAWRF